jgi:hypothetical protein
MVNTCWSDVEAVAHELAGNHQNFDRFAWWDQPADAQRWAIVYTHNRDDGILAQSNASVIGKELGPYLEAGDVTAERHVHWAAGWIAGFAIKVYDAAGEVTEAFRTYCSLQERLEHYPLLDEEDHSRREHDAALEHIEDAGRRFISAAAPAAWEGQVYRWLWDNDQRQLDDRDGTGAAPTDASVQKALTALGWLGKTEP